MDFFLETFGRLLENACSYQQLWARGLFGVFAPVRTGGHQDGQGVVAATTMIRQIIGANLTCFPRRRLEVPV